MNSHKSFKKAASLMLVAILLSRILGFVRDIIIAAKFGQGGDASAYTAAFNLPDLLYFFLSSGALSSAFIPVFTERFNTGRQKEAWQIFSIIACLMGLALTAAVVIFWVYARPLVSVLAVPGFVDKYPNLVDTTVILTKIILPCQLFFFIGGLMMGTLESRQKFSARAAGPVIYNAGIIFGALVLIRWFHIAGLAWGALIGAFAGNVVYAYYCLRKEGYEFYPSLNFRHPGVVRVGQLALPVILGLSLPQIDIIINKYFASFVSDSAPAALNYANRLMQLPLGIFAQAAGTAILPMLAAYAALNKFDEMRSGIAYGLRTILVENIPCTLFMVVMADPIVRVAYMRGEFKPSDVPLTAIALIFYSAGIFAWAGQAIVARGFFALQDTITPVLIGTVSTAIFIPTNYFLMKYMGIGGIALSTTIAATIHFLMLTWFLRKRLNGLEGTRTLKTAGRILIAAVAMAAVCYGVRLEMSKTIGSWQLQDGDFKQAGTLAKKLKNGSDPVSVYIYSNLLPDTRRIINDYQHAGWDEDAVKQSLSADFNKIIQGPSIYNSELFAQKRLSEEVQTLLKGHQTGANLMRLNRLLLACAYPSQITEGDEGKSLMQANDIEEPRIMAMQLANYSKLSSYIMGRLSPRTRELLAPQTMPNTLMHDMNILIDTKQIYSPTRFANIKPSENTIKLAKSNPSGKQLAHVNRLLMEAAYPAEIMKRPIDRVESFKASTVTVFLAMLLGGIVYFAMLRLLRVEEADFVWNTIRRKIFRQTS
ncbi:MAG: murein biosynthesis integral membrane protein MurJ [Armatimonadetes bacterium]|nr:murein biosynthesis integral membrane protein MurJ [Armatimonadota bacterium]